MGRGGVAVGCFIVRLTATEPDMEGLLDEEENSRPTLDKLTLTVGGPCVPLPLVETETEKVPPYPRISPPLMLA